jgi:hypothetical protein
LRTLHGHGHGHGCIILTVDGCEEEPYI